MSSLFSNKKELPDWLFCALSKEVMRDPVWIAGSKNPVNYEAKALHDYFEEHGHFDPKTDDEVDEKQVTENKALQRKIQDYIRDNPESWKDIPLHQPKR